MGARFVNQKEVERDLKDLADSIDDGPRSDVALEMAEAIRVQAKKYAPRGKTGNLRRGIVAKKFRTKGPSLAFAAVDYRIAPHAHLVEYGHAIVKGGRLKRGGKKIGMVAGVRFMEKAAKRTAIRRDAILETFGDHVKKRFDR